MRRKRTSTAPIAGTCTVLLLLAGAGGCTHDDAGTANQEALITRVASQGASKLTLSVSDDDPLFTDGLVLTVEASAPPGVHATLTDYATLLRESELGFELRVAHTKRTAPPPDGSGPRVWTDRYELEFVLPGEYELPAAVATFEPDPTGATNPPSRPAADDDQADTTNDGGPLELTTEGIHIVARDPKQVQLTEDQWDQIKTIPPYELPPKWSPWWWALGGLGALMLMAVLFRRRISTFFARRREQRAREVIVIPADVWARRQIAALIAEQLLERGAAQEFHYRVSYIVRGYIERRFNVSAGEMTTEEFLEAIVSDRRFASDITTELRPFMIACDLVKYARHQPTAEESMTALRAAEEFVERTRSADPAAPATGPRIVDDRECAA